MHSELGTIRLPLPVVTIIIDNALHNGATHGAQNGPLEMTIWGSNGRLFFQLRNEAGENHSEALRLQEERGENFIFEKLQESIATMGSKQSTKVLLMLMSKLLQHRVRHQVRMQPLHQ